MYLSRLLLLLLSSLGLYACGDPSPKPEKVAEVVNTSRLLPDPDANPSPMVTDTPAPVEQVPLEYLLGKVKPSSDTLFKAIPQAWTSKSGIYMHRDAWEAFSRMRAAAEKDGVKLTIVSAFRSFSDQKGIWENKWNGSTLVEGKSLAQTHPDPQKRALKILEFSSMPGTSRHHWGTDLDLNALTNDYFREGVGKKVYDWLTAHAAEYGFCQVYSPHGPDRPTGYNEERWHWSYLPVASKYLAAYPTQVGYEHLNGFTGWETAQQIDVIPKYVQGINPACLEK
jgi:LAS superfamily LD-carboxypeptidase LdcB